MITSRQIQQSLGQPQQFPCCGQCPDGRCAAIQMQSEQLMPGADYGQGVPPHPIMPGDDPVLLPPVAPPPPAPLPPPYSPPLEQPVQPPYQPVPPPNVPPPYQPVPPPVVPPPYQPVPPIVPPAPPEPPIDPLPPGAPPDPIRPELPPYVLDPGGDAPVSPGGTMPVDAPVVPPTGGQTRKAISVALRGGDAYASRAPR